ncbi:MAG: UpxY family transcription antiterminator [Gemmatimonadota bacterium]
MRGRPEGGHAGRAEPEPRWYALRTRARHERRVDGRLRGRDLESFLPLVPRARRWHDRTKIVEWPLFPGYVFVRLASPRLTEALSVAGVADVVRMAGRPSAIPSHEIEGVRAAVRVLAAAGETPEPEPLLERGDAVRVRTGAFAGVRGRVIERRGDRAAIQIGLTAIAQGVRLEVAVADLEPEEEADQEGEEAPDRDGAGGHRTDVRDA